MSNPFVRRKRRHTLSRQFVRQGSLYNIYDSTMQFRLL